MLDNGSMACAMSRQALSKLIEARVPHSDEVSPTLLTLIRCGGQKTSPLGVCDVNMKVFDCSFSVPALIVDGQCADLIFIKHFIHDMEISSDFQERVSDSQDKDSDTEVGWQYTS